MLGIVHLPNSQGLLSNFFLFTLGLEGWLNGPPQEAPPSCFLFGDRPPWEMADWQKNSAVSRGAQWSCCTLTEDPDPIDSLYSPPVSGFWFLSTLQTLGWEQSPVIRTSWALTLFQPCPFLHSPPITLIWGAVSVCLSWLAESLTGSFIWKVKSYFPGRILMIWK